MYPSASTSASPSSSPFHTPPSSTSSTPFSSSSHLPLSRPPTLKTRLSPSTPRLGRLQPKCLPGQGGGGRLEKYHQPASAIIPYPRGEVNMMECIEHRRGIRVLGKMEGYERDEANLESGEGEDPSVGAGGQVVMVRYETVGGRCKRIWEKVAFWDKAKGRTGGEDEDEEEEEGWD